jgi:hypothetical protein
MIQGGPFAGIAPKYASHILPNNAATVAENCVFTSGEMRPLKDTEFVWTPTKTGTVQTIWLYASTYWFHWLEEVNCCESPLASDAFGRAYWTGEAQPRMTTSSIATTGGGTDYPNNYYILGVPAPAAAPTNTEPTPSDENNIQSRAYIYTYVSAYGEEGPPTDPSELFDITDGDSVTVTLSSTGPTGAYNITAKNIYRLNDGVYQFLAQVSAATTTYADTVLNIALGDEITSEEYDPPPTALKGLFALPNGSLAGFTTTDLCISEPYLPHAWPVRYRVPFAGGIVSAGAFGNSILVTTAREKPYLLSGSDPASMYKEQFEVGHACLSKLGTVDMGNVVIFPSPFGLAAAGTGVAELLTKEVIDPNEWVDYANPSTLIGAKYGDNYIGFNIVDDVDSGFIFNVKTGDLSTIDIYATATYTDSGSGDLYLLVDGDIVQFDAGDDLEMTWESKDFILGRPTSFSRARVRATTYPVALHIYADGEIVDERVVYDKQPFTIGGNYMTDEWRYKIVSINAVKSVTIGNSVSEV